MMIGARTAAWAKSGGWVNPYVTDGLVAMWDGEWNAGGGVHDPNATAWTDIVGGNELALDSHSSWTYDALRPDVYVNRSYPMATMSSSSALVAQTHFVEIVARHKSADASFEFLLTTGTRGFIAFANVYGFSNGFAFASGERTYKVKTSDFTLSWDCRTAGDSRPVYSNGAPVISLGILQDISGVGPANTLSLGGRGNSDRAFLGDICAVRLYSSTLTPAKVAANYAIDKARFNLPDAA